MTMPPIYRHVVPNVPAWTAGNGKPIYRGNAPSYRRDMVFSASWSGVVSLAGYGFGSKGPPPDPTITSAEMNSLLQSVPFAARPFVYGDGVNWFRPEYVEYYRPSTMTFLDVPGKRIGISLSIGLVWSASLAYWQWAATPYLMSARLYYPDGDWVHVTVSSVAVGMPWFRSPTLTTTIRAGNGRTLNIDGWDGLDPADHWRASSMIGCSLEIRTHYA